MPSCCNPLVLFDQVNWEPCRKPAHQGQVASGVLLLITAIAVAIFLILHPPVTYSGELAFIAVMGTVGGAALITLIATSCIYMLVIRQRGREAEKEAFLEDPREESPIQLPRVVVETHLQANPIEHVRQTLLLPLLDEGKKLVKAVVKADALTSGEGAKIDKKLKEVDWAFEQVEELATTMMDDPKIYVSEVLRYFGRGKMPRSVALRRLIAAYNSKDKAKFEEAKKTYEAILRGYDFSDVAQALKTQTPADLMKNLPILLEKHFSLPDETLQGMGKEVLDHIFAATKENPAVLTALKALMKKAHSKSDIVKEVEGFIKVVYQEAQIPEETLQGWNDRLIKHMLDTQFKKTVCKLLGMMARNIRILKLLFDEGKNKEELFTTLDETFLLSESSDCIKQEELQTEVLRLQSKINVNRSEKKRIALIILPEGDTRDYPTLRREEEVIETCFAANPCNLTELQHISSSEEVQALAERRKIRLVALPISISDHPFKLFKNNEKLIGGFAWIAVKALGGLLPTMVKPAIIAILPQMEREQQNQFEALFEKLVGLLINPIFNGAISHSPFRTPFQRIICNQGEELANRLEELIGDEDLTFEKIRDVWTKAIQDVAQQFNEVT